LKALPELQVHPFHPAVLLGGLALALALNLWPVLAVGARRADGEQAITARLRARPWNLVCLGIAGVTLGLLLVYSVVENLGHA
jgi:hypothetical protein